MEAVPLPNVRFTPTTALVLQSKAEGPCLFTPSQATIPLNTEEAQIPVPANTADLKNPRRLISLYFLITYDLSN
jgi:hypothetical protein